VLVHRHPDAFPDPDVFRPDRFASEAADGAPDIPFGGGERRCLGEQLALTAIHSALPAVLRHVRLAPVSPEPERMVARGTAAVPHRGALAVAAQR
jgi:cytochrome P450